MHHFSFLPNCVYTVCLSNPPSICHFNNLLSAKSNMHIFVRQYNKSRKQCIPETQLSVRSDTCLWNGQNCLLLSSAFGVLFHYYHQLTSRLTANPSNIEDTKVHISVDQSSHSCPPSGALMFTLNFLMLNLSLKNSQGKDLNTAFLGCSRSDGALSTSSTNHYYYWSVAMFINAWILRR